MGTDLKKLFFASALVVLSALGLAAQPLVRLPKASEVDTGTLPNGIEYFLVSNPGSKGVADFALVRKGAVQTEGSGSVLSSLPHFQKESPYQFLAKLGAGYRDYGYIQSSKGSVTYHFEDVPVDVTAVRDTALLMLFDIAGTWPYEQAVVVSGDIDKASVLERMKVFSMMITPRLPLPEQPPYEWRATDGIRFLSSVTPDQEEAVVSAIYSSPRTPEREMGTLVPLVTDLFMREFGKIVDERLETAFLESGIPLAGLDFHFRSSADGPFAEQMTISATVGRDRMAEAASVMGRVLAGLDVHGAELDEFQGAKDALLSSADAERTSLSNSDWVDRCASAYLFGASLASRKDINGFFASRNIASRRELELFNGFVSALIDSTTAVTLHCTAPEGTVDKDSVISSFTSGWAEGASDKLQSLSSHGMHKGDTLSLAVPRSKAKLKKTAPEPVTGGEVWTFSNGMKVICRKTDDHGRFSYGFLLNGGFSGVRELQRGEGGFIEDMLLTERIASMSGRSFSRMLEANGVEFHPSVSLTDLKITGSAPSSKLELLLKSLIGVAGDRAVDTLAYSYFREAEKLRLSVDRKRQAGIDAVVDSIMSPDYRFTASKLASGLTDDLPVRAEEYFESVFSRCGDGVLVLAGDIDLFRLKKVLPKYLGAFRTDGTPSARPQIQYTPRSGWSTYTVEAAESDVGNGDPSITVSASAPVSFNIDMNMSFRVALKALRAGMAAALAETGMYAEVSGDFMLVPSERLNVTVTCRPADADGLPSDVYPADPLKVLGAVRGALSGLASEPVSAAFLKWAKASLLAECTADASDPEKIVDMALMRYSGGKDLVSGYKDRVNAVTAKSVQEIFSLLSEGSKVEYVIY